MRTFRALGLVSMATCVGLGGCAAKDQPSSAEPGDAGSAAAVVNPRPVGPSLPAPSSKDPDAAPALEPDSGAAPEPPQRRPGECQESNHCSSEEYCEISCEPEPSTMGACMTRPASCTREFAPVCGCDGKTYANECERRSAGVGTRSRGACPMPGTVDAGGPACGGSAGTTCSGDKQMCEYPVGTCGEAAAVGVCEPLPERCLALFDPVCGCDGKTYGNDCQRRSAGVAKKADGSCKQVR